MSYAGQPVTSFVLLSTLLIVVVVAVVAAGIAVVVVVLGAVFVVFSALALSNIDALL